MEHHLVNGGHDTPADHQTDSDVEDRHQMEMLQRSTQMSRAEQQRDVSALLGEKMLQGWTLLGDCCPR